MKRIRSLLIAAALPVAIGSSFLADDADAAGTKHVTICTKDSSGSDIAGVSLSYYSGSWQPLGVSSAAGCFEGDVAATTSHIAAQHRGIHNQLPAGGSAAMFTFQTQPRFARLVDSGGNGVAGAALSFYAGSWQSLGTSGADGCASAELLPGNIYFGVDHRGIHNQRLVATGVTPSDSCESATTFQTQPRFARLVDSGGNGVAGAALSFYAGSWQSLGTSGADGCASTELLPGNIYFGVDHRGIHNQTLVATGVTPSDSCASATTFQTQKVDVRLVDSHGIGLAGGVVDFYAGSWQPLGTTGDDGKVITSVELLPGSVHWSVTRDGLRVQSESVSSRAVHTFSTTPIEVLVRDGGVRQAGVVVRYYAGTWRDLGETDVNGYVVRELLPHVTYVRANGFAQVGPFVVGSGLVQLNG